MAFQNRGRFGSNRGQNRTLGAKTEHWGRFGPYFSSRFGHVQGQIGMLMVKIIIVSLCNEYRFGSNRGPKRITRAILAARGPFWPLFLMLFWPSYLVPFWPPYLGAVLALYLVLFWPIFRCCFGPYLGAVLALYSGAVLAPYLGAVLVLVFRCCFGPIF